jgi:hypothetical protein
MARRRWLRVDRGVRRWPPSRADVGPLVPILALWGLL